MKKFHIYDEVYNKRLCVFICPPQEMKDYLQKRYKIIMEFNGYNGMQWVMLNKKTHLSEYCIWLADFDWTIPWQKNLVHELLHHISEVLRDVGIEHTEDTEEAYTYYMEHLFEQCWKKLRPKQTKPS